MPTDLRYPVQPVQRRAAPGLDRLAREDIDAVTIAVGEEVQFVSAYFDDASDSITSAAAVNGDNLDPETGRDGSQVVWVENARSGDYFPVRQGTGEDGNNNDPNNNSDNMIDTPEMDESSPLLLPTPLTSSGYGMDAKIVDSKALVQEVENGDSSSHSTAAMFLQGMFLLFQGMLAGFSFINFSYLVMDDSTLLVTYSAAANEMRRISFVLSTLATLGAMDQLITLISSSARPSLSSGEASTYSKALIKKENSGAYVLGISACLLYLATLVMTIICSGTDTLVYYHFGYEGNVVSDGTWVDLSLAHSAYQTRITEWRSLIAARVVTAALAWVCSCMLVWGELVAKDGRGHELVRLEGVIHSWRKRVDLLEGNSLEGLEGGSLRKLAALQRLGCERTGAALRVVEHL